MHVYCEVAVTKVDVMVAACNALHCKCVSICRVITARVNGTIEFLQLTMLTSHTGLYV